MKRIGLFKAIFVAFLLALGLLIVTADRRERASVDLLRPTTILRLVASRLHALHTYVGELIDGGTAGFRETVQKHESPKKSLER